MLKKDDFVVLLKLDREGALPSMANAPCISRLKKANVIDSGGSLTADGIIMADTLKSKLRKLEKGIPFSKRTKTNPLAIYDEKLIWVTGSVGRKSFVSDSHVLYFGTAVKGKMETSKTTESTKTLAKGFHLWGGLTYEEAVPYAYQVTDGLNGWKSIWLTGKEGKNTNQVCIKASYFDFLVNRYPNAVIKIASRKPIGGLPVLFCLDDKGITSHNEVAVLMPVLGSMIVPNLKLRG